MKGTKVLQGLHAMVEVTHHCYCPKMQLGILNKPSSSKLLRIAEVWYRGSESVRGFPLSLRNATFIKNTGDVNVAKSRK
jgi:hypothetical protein